MTGARSAVFNFSGRSEAEPFFGRLMRFHFMRHGRRGLSNEVAEQEANRCGDRLPIRIADFREIVQFIKGLFAAYRQIGRFWHSEAAPRSIQRANSAVIWQKPDEKRHFIKPNCPTVLANQQWTGDAI